MVMKNLAFKVAVIESEAGWGSKIDDYMVCLTVDDAELFKVEFDSENTESATPDWYMCTYGNPIPIDLNDTQYDILMHRKRIWYSLLS
jgi:hypothetical protein